MVEQRSYTTLFSMQHGVDEAHMYLFDFGTNGLMPGSHKLSTAVYRHYFYHNKEDKIRRYVYLMMKSIAVKNSRIHSVAAYF